MGGKLSFPNPRKYRELNKAGAGLCGILRCWANGVSSSGSYLTPSYACIPEIPWKDLISPPGNKTSGHIEESWKVLTSAYVQQKVRERVIPRAKSNFLAQIIVLLWG